MTEECGDGHGLTIVGSWSGQQRPLLPSAPAHLTTHHRCTPPRPAARNHAGLLRLLGGTERGGGGGGILRCPHLLPLQKPPSQTAPGAR
jgi:hypothetical protein